MPSFLRPMAVTAPTAGAFGSDPNNLASFSTNREVVDGSGNVLLTDAAVDVLFFLKETLELGVRLAEERLGRRFLVAALGRLCNRGRLAGRTVAQYVRRGRPAWGGWIGFEWANGTAHFFARSLFLHFAVPAAKPTLSWPMTFEAKVPPG